MTLAELITTIRTHPGDEDTLITGYLATKTRTIRMLAIDNTRRFGLPRDTQPDLEQEIMLSAYTLIRTFLTKNTTPEWSFSTYMRRRALNCATQLTRTAGANHLSGMGGQERRQRYLATRKAELTTTLARTPTTSELLAYANQHAQATRKNPTKQGMVFTRKDLTPTRTLSTDAFRDDYDYEPAQPPDPPATLLAHDIITQCAHHSPLLGSIAAHWLRPITSGQADTPGSFTHTARAFTLDRQQADAALALIRDTTRRITGEHE